MADSYVEEILQEWGFEAFIQVFKVDVCMPVDEDIDKAALLSLTDSLLVPLLPKIGQRARFMAKLTVLQNKKSDETVTQSVSQPANQSDQMSATSGCSTVVEDLHLVEQTSLPAVYQLPAFSPHLKQKLQQKELTPEVRRLIVNALYEDVAKLTLNPGRFCASVACALVSRHPHLADTIGNGWDSWRVTLRNKFKNVRRKATGPVVEENRRKYGHAASKRSRQEQDSSDAADTSVKRKMLSPSTTAEDDVSIAAHVRWLQKQFKRQHQNRDSAGIKERMDRTYVDRMRTIEQSPVPAVLEKYVFLCDADEFIADFGRRTAVDADKAFLTAVNSLATPIGRICGGMKGAKQIIDEHEVSAADPATAVCAKVMCTFRLLLKYLKENEKALMQPEDGNLPLGPIITYDGTEPLHSTDQLFKLHVDKHLLFEAYDFTQALVACYAAYWIFNIQYNSRIFNFLTFLEKQVFGLGETVARPPVVKLMKLLQ